MVLPLKSNKSTKTLVGVGKIPDPPLWYKSGEQRHRLVSTQEPLNHNCILRMSHVSTSGAGEQVCLGRAATRTRSCCSHTGNVGARWVTSIVSLLEVGSVVAVAGAWQTLVESQPRGPQRMKRSGDSLMLRSSAVTFSGRFHARGIGRLLPKPPDIFKRKAFHISESNVYEAFPLVQIHLGSTASHAVCCLPGPRFPRDPHGWATDGGTSFLLHGRDNGLAVCLSLAALLYQEPSAAARVTYRPHTWMPRGSPDWASKIKASSEGLPPGS